MSNIEIETNFEREEEEAPEVKETQDTQEAKEVQTEEQDSSEEVEPKEEEEESKEAQENEESEGDESDEETSEDEEQKVDKKKSGIQKLKFQRNKAREEADYWREQALKREQAEAPKEEETLKADTTQKPDPDEFDTQEEYLEALSDFKVEQKMQAFEKSKQEAELKAKADEASNSFREKVETFKESVTDFDEILEDVDHINMSISVQQCVLESENGPRLMYELAKDPTEYERICQLSPLAAARAVGRIEAKFSDETTKPVPSKKLATTKTKAPKPITPVGSSKVGAVTKDVKDMSFREYKEARHAGRI